MSKRSPLNLHKQILKYHLRTFCLLKAQKLNKFCFNKGIHGKVAFLFIAKNDSLPSFQYILVIALVLEPCHEEWHLSISLLHLQRNQSTVLGQRMFMFGADSYLYKIGKRPCVPGKENPKHDNINYYGFLSE